MEKTIWPEVEVLPSRLDRETAEKLTARLVTLRGRDLDLDGSAVEHFDSHSVRFLMTAFGVWKDDGRRLRVIDPAPVVEEIFHCLDLGRSPDT